MEHKPLAELQARAHVHPISLPVSISREQRLQRWFDILESDSERRLCALREIEHLSEAQRRECRADNSPLTVAYEDPILRAAGLRSDRIGDCTEFFGLNDAQVHHAFCSCHVGFTLSAGQAARRLRRAWRMGRLRASFREVIGTTFRRLFRWA